MSMTVFQSKMMSWTLRVLPMGETYDIRRRILRFVEESAELAQSAGLSAEEVTYIVKHVFGRPKGEVAKETGACMTTLAAFCNAAGLDLQSVAAAELQRISEPTVVEKIKAKANRMLETSSLVDGPPTAAEPVVCICELTGNPEIIEDNKVCEICDRKSLHPINLATVVLLIQGYERRMVEMAESAAGIADQ